MPTTRYKSYIICTSPRSGSTLLCKLLALTGKSGNPESYFHNPSITDWLKSFQITRDDFASDRDALQAAFNAACNHGTGNTRLFGLRMQRHSFDYFVQQLGILYPGRASDIGRIKAAFGHTLFIHLTRTNKLDQAISWVKATQTGLWHRAADGSDLERLSAPQEPFYDANEIAHNIGEFTQQDEAWNIWFDQENLCPMRMTYDELNDHPTKALARVLHQLGLEKTLANGIEPPVIRLADAINRRWADRFVADRGKLRGS